MSTHTPGPWRAQKSDKGTRLYLMTVKASPTIVCEWGEFEWPEAGDLALMTAAPVLLGIVKSLVVLIESGRMADLTSYDIDQLKACVAKAEGQEP